MPNTSSLTRFIFECDSIKNNGQHNIRGAIVHLDATLKTILQQHDYPNEVNQLLSQALCASVLLSMTIKYEGQLTLQFQGSDHSALKMLVAKCDHLFQIRGTAKWDEEALPQNLLTDFANGRLVVTLKDDKTHKQYQSIVPIAHQSISKALENYFYQSEQLATKLWFAYDPINLTAKGLLLQQLPNDNTHENLDYDQQDYWEHVTTLAKTLTDQELLNWDAETVLHKLYHQEQIRLFPANTITFHCPCNADKMLSAIQLLGEQEAMAILSTNSYIEVTCEYCNNQFSFTKNEVAPLFTKH